MACVAQADTLRIATWAGDFSRKGPGLLLRDLNKNGTLPGLETVLAAKADILVLTEIDYDAGLIALGAVAETLADQGLDYPYLFAGRPNGGMPTGRDLDQDGRRGGPRDAQGYGWFSGQGGQAILSRWPLRLTADYSALLWKDLPDSRIAADDPGFDIQRLSTSAHWAVEVAHPDGALTLLTVSATPPVFDGPEDRNGRRNADEVRLWPMVLDGALGPVPSGRTVLVGLLNLDPAAGQGLRAQAQQVLQDPRWQDPLPGLPTATWDRVGALRVDYVLPDTSFAVQDAGLLDPAQDSGAHSLVWVDLRLDAP